MLRVLFFILSIPFYFWSMAQQPHRTCGAHHITERHLLEQGMSTDLLHHLPVLSEVERGGTFTIPVVVHVVYNNSAENVPAGTINALIAELNEDYSAANSDLSGVRSAFTNSIGNVGFQFCLAQIDPNGNATTGITRTATSQTWFDPDTETNAMKSAPDGIAPWDTERYLNIWICDITSGAPGGTITVGYAYLPTGGVVGSNIDGLVIDYDYGTEPGARTATHEIGHYFGLLHTFDDDGACVNADGFSDTPTSNSPTFSCSNTNLMKCGNLVQYENFMDYSSCTVMFTNQQANYMAGILTGVRDGLLTNPACSGPAGGYCAPTSANGPSDGDYINGVALGSIINTNSGSTAGPAYTDYSSTIGTTLTRGTTYSIQISGGTYSPDNYAAWIDYDQDEQFEASEKLGEFTTSTSNETQSLSFTVPGNASLGDTRLRVRGVYHDLGEPSPTDPCFAYAFGETEDYRITVQAAGQGPCVPTSANGTSDGDYINSVVLGALLNLNSGAVDGPTYTDHGTAYTTSMARGSVQGILIQSGSYESDHYAAWIDYDQDDQFEASEKLGEFTTTEPGEVQSIPFIVPMSAQLGATTLRVRGVYHGQGEPSPTDPCANYAYGETEDYTIQITVMMTGHCVPLSLNGTSDGDFIDGVVLEEIDNTGTGDPEGPSYTNYSAAISTALERSEEYTLSVTSGDYAPDEYAVWIDYDQDQVFEASELLGSFQTSAPGQTFDITFTVPTNAALGATRMRVRGVYIDAGELNPVDPCYPYIYGETEDYGVMIELSTDLLNSSERFFGMHPNPASDQVLIHTEVAASIELIDLQGRAVRSLSALSERTSLDLAGLASGTYLVRVSTPEWSRTERLEILPAER